ncbi:MAG: exopolysaccharide biosynthesis protein [Alphaproteobacteria bacterium]|nr:exopolysaccharide biosynthesis protein [Alphaproteobacteria bacterium]
MQRLAAEWPAQRITLGDMIHAFGERGYGLLVILFAIPNLLPIYIPGLSPIFGVPLLIVCLQLALGWPEPRLPGILTRRSMRRADLEMIVAKATPWILRVERFIRPRPSLLTTRTAERLIGLYGVALAALVIVPLPFTNGPPSLACLIMAMGIMERDSITILAGALWGLVATVLALSIIGGFLWVLQAGLAWMLSLFG